MEQLMLDLIPTGAKAVCHVSQNDIGRTIRFNLTSGNTAYTLAGTETIKVFIKKPDGTTAERNIANTSSTYVDWVTGEGDCDVAGKNECELVITSGTTVIGSKNFTMKVEEDPYNGQGVVIETASGNPAVFDTNIVDLFVEIKCSVNAIQEGTPWIDSNVIEKEPYNFRKVAGTASRIGNHLFDKLVGGTVAWNQLAKNGDFTTGAQNFIVHDMTHSVANNKCTLTVNNSNDPYIEQVYNGITGHAYLLLFNIISYSSASGGYRLIGFYNGISGATVKNITGVGISSVIVKNTTTSDQNRIRIGMYTATVGDEIVVTGCQIFDLTAMFGSTIADYIYSLEQATAGSGVNFFRKLFPDSYYAYDVGSLKSVKTTAHKLTGKNICATNLFSDGSSGGVSYSMDANGKITISADSSISNAQRIDIGSMTLPAGTYILSGIQTDANRIDLRLRTNISQGSTEFAVCDKNNPSVSFTLTEKTTFYAVFIVLPNFVGTTVCEQMIRISSISDANYEPYTEHNYALDDVELRGLFKLDSNNKLYADGDTYESSGDVGRRYNIVDMGSIEWRKSTSPSPYNVTHFVSFAIPTIKKPLTNNVICNAICVPYIVSSVNWGYTGNIDKAFGINTNGQIYVYDSSKTDLTYEEFKTAMSGIYLIFEVETPTTEQADPFTNPQQVDANGTEEYVDNRAVAIPVGHETYYADIYQISGHTELNLLKRGINQWDEQTEKGNIDTTTGENTPYNYMLRSVNYIKVSPNTTLYTPASWIQCYFYYADKTYISYQAFAGHIITVPNNAEYMRFRLSPDYGTTYNNDISINYPSTYHDYHAYAGELVTVAFGQTVYTCYLNVTTGKLIVTHIRYEFDGSQDENWVKFDVSGQSFKRFAIVLSNTNQPTDVAILCDIFTPVSFNNRSFSTNNIAWLNTQPDCTLSVIASFDDVNSWRNFLSSSKLHIVAKLATPTEVQLTAHQLETILGQNILSHDCNGDTEVKYLYNA